MRLLLTVTPIFNCHEQPALKIKMSVQGLTNEQRRKIEENKQQALAKRAKKVTQLQNGSRALAVAASCPTQRQTDETIIHNRLHTLVKRHLAVAPSDPYKNKQKQSSFSSASSSSQRFTITNLVQSTKLGADRAHVAVKFSGPACSSVPQQQSPIRVQQLKGKCVLVSQDSFSVDVGYHSGLIEFFKKQKSRSYDAAKKTWSFKLEEYDSIIKGLNVFRPDVEIDAFPRHILDVFRPQAKEKDIIPDADLTSVPVGLVNTLKAFQREGVNIAIHRKGRLLLADDMGLGKTLQAICVAAYYRKEWPLLVVAPSSVRYDWAQQICKWLPDVSDSDVNVVVTGKASATSSLVNIISYDLLAKKSQELRQQRFKIIIMDESHFLKNYKTVRTKAAMPLLASAKRVLLLSGTPALSRPSELFCQISAVCPHLFKFHDFGLRYCAAKQLPWGWDYSGSSNMLELQLLLEKCVMIRRQKKEVLSQLPEKTRQMVVLDPGSVKHHKGMKVASKIMDKVKDKGQERRGALLMYFQETSKAKLSAVREYILDLLESDKKILVFAHHREMLDAVEDCIQSQGTKMGYIRIDGTTSSEQRSHFCKKFQTKEEYRVAVLSITAANAGLNLSAANIVVFAELFWNPGILVQAEDRAHRMGQKDSVSVQYLVAKGTADDYIWPLIQVKLDVLGKAGLTRDDFSYADTKIMTDPSQSTLLDLFSSDFIETSMPRQDFTDMVLCSSDPQRMNDAGQTNLTNRVVKPSSPCKRQASITNFMTKTPPKKMKMDQQAMLDQDSDPSSTGVNDVIAINNDDEVALTSADLAAMETFDWDEQI